MSKLQWQRPTATGPHGHRTTYRSKCGRYTITRWEWMMPRASSSYRLEGAGGKRGFTEECTLREAKDAAQEHADELLAQQTGT